MKNSVYICHTIYHILIMLCQLEEQENIDIILFDSIPNVERFRNILGRKTRILSLKQEGFDDISLSTYEERYLFNDWTNIGAYLRENALPYYLIEDGYNYFSFDHYKEFFSRKRRLLYLFERNVLPFGHSKFAHTIEVNDLSLVVKDMRYKKMIERPRQELFSTLSQEKKSLLMELFPIPHQVIQQERKKVLILAQPLFQDGFIRDRIYSIESQIAFYEEIVRKYQEQYAVYFKVHPRDTTVYPFEQVLFLDKDTPMEIYEFIGDLQFDVGITHSSTALEYLSCVKEKIFLKD